MRNVGKLFLVLILGLSFVVMTMSCGSSGTKLVGQQQTKQEKEVVVVSLVSNEVAVIDPINNEIIGTKTVGTWGEYTNNHFDYGKLMWFNNGRNLYAVRIDDFDLITSAFGFPQFGPQQSLLSSFYRYTPSCHITQDASGNNLFMPMQVAQPIARGLIDFSLETTFIDVTPDGKYVYASRRGEDDICVIDNNLNSPNFGKILRCINVVTGRVTDSAGNLVREYSTLYKAGRLVGGNRGVRGAAGRCNINQNTCRAGVCDASIILREDGKVVFCEPDWYGNTITCLDISDNDRLYQYLLPVLVRNSRMPGGFMATISTNLYNGRHYFFVENLDPSLGSTNECRGSEYILDVTNLSDIRLVQMIVPKFSCLDGISSENLLDGEIYNLNVRYIYSYNYNDAGAVTGIRDQETYSVGYRFRRTNGFVSSGYLEKINPSDPGPQFITDGVPVAPFTNDARPIIVSETPNGRIIKHDEVYIVGIAPGFGQIGVVSYRGFRGDGNPPFPVSNRINLIYNTTSAVVTFTLNGRKAFVNDRTNPIVYVIDTFTKSVSDVIPVPAASQAMLTTRMLVRGRTQPSPVPGGGGGGSIRLPNPCG